MLSDQRNINNSNDRANIKTGPINNPKPNPVTPKPAAGTGSSTTSHNATPNRQFTPRRSFGNRPGNLNFKPGEKRAAPGTASSAPAAGHAGQSGDGARRFPFKRSDSKPGFGGNRRQNQYNRSNQPYQYPYSKVMLTKRVDKVVSGGRNSSFVAIVVVGNCVDRVGVGTASGKTIVDAIAHAKQKAANRVIVPSKIKYLKYKHCATEVIIKRRNVDIIRTAGYISSIFKACGLKNISCKIIGSNNPMNTIYAVFNALTSNIQFKRNTMILRGILKQQQESREA